MEWATDIQFPEGRRGDDEPEHKATYIFQSRVKATEEYKGNCLMIIYIIRTFLIVPVRSLQLISVVFKNVITTAQKTHCVSATKTNCLIRSR
jgi:hypothetical protein